MSYDYQTERPKLFTEEGQVQFLRVRDTANRLLKTAGAVRMDCLIEGLSGDVWGMLACADRLVELKEMVEVSPPDCAGQYRIFTRY
jgi:hypothetical protein